MTIESVIIGNTLKPSRNFASLSIWTGDILSTIDNKKYGSCWLHSFLQEYIL